MNDGLVLIRHSFIRTQVATEQNFMFFVYNTSDTVFP